MKNLEYKVGIFVISTFIIIALFLSFVAYKKDMFSESYKFVIQTDLGDGLSIGMPVTFSGFEIGKVSDLELRKDGMVYIYIKIPERHIHWMREDSVFVLDKPLIGSPKIQVFSPNLDTATLSENAVVVLYTIDGINEAIQKLQPILVTVKQILKNVEDITFEMSKKDGSLQKTLANIQKITLNLSKKNSAIEMATGNKEDAVHISNIIAELQKSSEHINELLANTNKAIYGQKGLFESINGEDAILGNVNDILREVEIKLRGADEIIEHITKTTANIEGSTRDLSDLRDELEVTIKSTNRLINNIDSKIPFQEQREIELP